MIGPGITGRSPHQVSYQVPGSTCSIRCRIYIQYINIIAKWTTIENVIDVIYPWFRISLIKAYDKYIRSSMMWFARQLVNNFNDFSSISSSCYSGVDKYLLHMHMSSLSRRRGLSPKYHLLSKQSSIKKVRKPKRGSESEIELTWMNISTNTNIPSRRNRVNLFGI